MLRSTHAPKSLEVDRAGAGGPTILTTKTTPPRPVVRGKFLFAGEEKLYVRGVSYGPFRPTADGCEYHEPESVARDFRLMSRSGINAVRTYTVPPEWLLDLASDFNLYVMVGLPWEQHVAFLDELEVARSIERRVRDGVRACAGHPAILCYSIGNEIPSHIARWSGRRRVERFLERLHGHCKNEDADGLVTYANFPSTEYLDLPFLDFVSFNVYLETQATLESYLARLQNIADDRPLVVTELGLDALKHGCDMQARVLEWQTRSIFASGCAGMFAFSWTDEWYRGGYDIDGWEFGVTTRQREPKPALAAISSAFNEIPFPPQHPWPKVSVIVCTHNGSRTLNGCLEGLRDVDYPLIETLVVDDGSTDASAEIAARFDVKLIRTANLGLSSARNTGLRAATGEIVAYLDDDARPDRHWLRYLVSAFRTLDCVGVGGPNIPPPEDTFFSHCVSHAPGGPTHVLMTDRIAEHVPGCNMAFKRAALLSIGGFDEQFRIAGDDVDVCWQLQQRGWTLGFSPAAMVWHHRRSSCRGYWRQQLNYGRAEAMLERKWPQKYNAMGNPTWSGRLYGRGSLHALGWSSARIYHGTWGSALFQSVYHRAPSPLVAVPTTPEWYLVLLLLTAISAWGFIWPPLLWGIPLLVIAATITAVQAVTNSTRSLRTLRASDKRWGIWRFRAVTALLHLLQPAARLSGKLMTGLTPWRQRSTSGWAIPWRRSFNHWCEQSRSLEQRLGDMERSLQVNTSVVVRGGDFDDWDFEIRCGVMGAVRLRMTVEQHAEGREMVRLRAWPTCSRAGGLLTLVLIFISDAAALSHAWETWAVSGLCAALLLHTLLRETGGGMATVRAVTRGWNRR